MMKVNGPNCAGCPLEERGTIFIPSDGLGSNRVLIVGDSGWIQESFNVRDSDRGRVGTPFSGPSGAFIDRQLRRLGRSRSDFTIANSFWCKAPHLGFTDHPERYPDAAVAQEHCRPYLDELIDRTQPRVIVPLGNVALRRVTGLDGIEKYNGYYLDTKYGIPAIPTFHPSFIMKGNQKLSGIWCHSVQRALNIAEKEEKPREYRLLLDPPLSEAREYFVRQRSMGPYRFVCDIETVETDVDEDEREDSSFTITRISFSNEAGTAITMPWQPPYIDLIREVLAAAGEVVFWNQSFDVPRLKANGCTLRGRIVDAMFAWHFLQSDLPKALGFVAPLFLTLRPWKYLNASEPARYSALDSAVTMDLMLGIKEQLEREGRWAAFDRHHTQTIPILERMSDAGVMIDLEEQKKFAGSLKTSCDSILAQLQTEVPEKARQWKRWKTRPQVMDVDGWTEVTVGRKKEAPVKVRVQAHSTTVDKKGNPSGYEALLPFNPASPEQVKDLIRALGLPVPKLNGDESTEDKFLKSLAKKAPVFKTIREHRRRNKLLTSYIWEVRQDGRVHAIFGHAPSTWRKSARKPPVQTVPKHDEIDSDPLAGEYRRTIIASPGNVLVECDSSAIEAVLVGFYAASPRYIELAKRGVHKWLAEQYAGRKVSKQEPLYDQIKRVVHLSNYMGTPQRIREEYQDLFGSVKAARELQEFYFNTEAGKDVRRWQQQTLDQAHRERYLQIPYGYRHYFYDVYNHRNGAWVMGDDAKRAVAFRPQATASAIQTEFLLELWERGAEWDFDPAWLRWIVHDSIVAEVPERLGEQAARGLRRCMMKELPELGGLSIGAEAKIGPNLRDMEVVN